MVWRRLTIKDILQNGLFALLGQRRQWHPTPVLLPGKSHGQGWWAAVHGVAKRRAQLSYFTFTFHFHALEKEMATHSSILAWRIPEMGEPGGLLSMGSHRVRYDWSDLAAAALLGSHQQHGCSEAMLGHLGDHARETGLYPSLKLGMILAIGTGIVTASNPSVGLHTHTHTPYTRLCVCSWAARGGKEGTSYRPADGASFYECI